MELTTYAFDQMEELGGEQNRELSPFAVKLQDPNSMLPLISHHSYHAI
jgi:hypothetical protein